MKYNIKTILLVLFVAGGQFSLYAQSLAQKDSARSKNTGQIKVLYGTQDYSRFVGNTESVKGDDLRTYPSMTIQEALQGRLPGYFMRQDNGNPGEDNFTNYVRGSVGGYVTLVDGVERPLSSYDIEQIAEVRLLKDPVSKALYGGRMTNGILLVTTRRGKAGKSEFHAGVQRSVKMPSRLPKYLNSYDFARYYNQALANDNITTGAYNQAALDGYKDHSNAYQYPDVDFYGEFLNKSMNLTRVNMEYNGGNENTQFYVHGAYQKEGGFETYGNRGRQQQNFNLQGNVDTRFSDAITLHANFAGYAAFKQYPGAYSNTPNADGSHTNGTYLLYTLANRYPNAYPVFVGKDSAGGTASYKDNPYAGEALSGYTTENYLRTHTDLSFDVKLDKLLKGLYIRPAYAFDVAHKQNLQKLNTVGIYSISSYDLAGNPAGYTSLQTPVKATSQALGDDDDLRRWAFTGTAGYRAESGKSMLDVDLDYYISKAVNAGDTQSYKRQNLGLRVNYTYSGKYTLEAVLEYSGSQSFATDKRFKYFPALGAGWLISKEHFLKEVSFIDFLKLNAAWGISGDGNIAINQYRQSWGATATYNFSTASTAPTTQLNQIGTASLNWPKQREIDINLEATIFKAISWKLSYFDYLQYDLLSQRANITPVLNGGLTFLPWTNFGKTGLKGYEAELSYNGNAGKLQFRVGGHFTYGKSNKILIDELPDPKYRTQGSPWDAIRGYHAMGTYTQADVDQIAAGTSALPLPSYMDPKALRAGNIKYADLNGDKVIDKYDTRVIGNNAPRIMYGGDISLKYKGFDLYVMVLGYGSYKTQLNSSYYQVFSTRKYSDPLIKGLPNGNAYPRLTTGSGTNDFQTSDYWSVNGGFLKLKNVALSYTLPARITGHLKMQEVKIVLYGSNLATLSKIKDSDPESMNAGLADYPLFRTLTAGLNITF